MGREPTYSHIVLNEPTGETVSAMENKWMEVESLVLRAQGGDREALGALIERFQGSVFAAVRGRQRDAHEAAELVQEVFLHVMRKIGQLRKPACFGAWLQKITVRVAINRATRRPPLQTTEPEMLEQNGKVVSSPLEDLMRQEERDKVRLAVAKLRPIDRDALVAFYIKGKSLVEIADEFAIPLGTVKRRLHMARHRLEESLQESGLGGSRHGGDDTDEVRERAPHSRPAKRSTRKRRKELVPVGAE